MKYNGRPTSLKSYKTSNFKQVLKILSRMANDVPRISPTHENLHFLYRPFSYSAKSLDRALFLYIFIHEIRSSGVRASITIVHIRKFYKM